MVTRAPPVVRLIHDRIAFCANRRIHGDFGSFVVAEIANRRVGADVGRTGG